MTYPIQAFDFGALAVASEQTFAASAFNGIKISADYNKLGHDGDGKLIVIRSGAEPVKLASQLVVLAGIEGDFAETRRVFYIKPMKPGDEGTPPDCTSFNGKVPDASSPSPQAVACKTCIHTNVAAGSGESKCAYRKTAMVYLAERVGENMLQVDTTAAFTWDASSKSIFPKWDKESKSAGLLPMVKELVMNKYTVEATVLELGFFQGYKAPVLRPAQTLQPEQTMAVIDAASQPEVKALLAWNAERAAKPSGAALPAPTRAPALSMDSPRAAATAAVTRTPRPAPPPEVVIPEAELYQAPVAAPAAPVESEDERDEREMMEALAAKKAMRAAAANKPAADKVIESTATVQTMPRAVAPPVTAAPAAAPVAVTAPAGQRGAALGAFGAARKPG